MAEHVIHTSGPVAEDNIINRRGGESIYQSCMNLKRRLTEVRGFEPNLAEMDEEDRAKGITDPVASLWNYLRNGYPLLTLYNATAPDEILELDCTKVAEAKRPKAATFKFLQACLQELAFPQQDCFLITDLYGESTTGFIKVIKMVNKVLDILEIQGLLKQPSGPSPQAPSAKGGVKLTKKEHILKELLETERDYVHHLQNLQALKKELEETGALTGDGSHQIFLNLNNLLDFAQRFLIRMEQHYALPVEEQNWGELFVCHGEAFRQYEPFISNQMRCDEACLKEWDKIHAAPRTVDLRQMVALPATLNGFFVKPFQRMTKYPLMLTELRKQIEDPSLKEDITKAIDTIQSVLDSANDAIDKEHLASARSDLIERVDDWKTLNFDQIGDLLRYGTFPVLKSESNKEPEREYHMYLFQKILLCCKDANPNKQKAKLMVSKEKIPTHVRGKPRLQIKGRIYMANVTHIVSMNRPGSHKIQIFWNGDPGVADSFTIRYHNEDLMKKWYQSIDTQRLTQAEERNARHTGTSETEFISMQSMTANLTNPYLQQYDAEEQGMKESSEFPMSRTASSTSLRTRSATNGSGASVRPNRIPMPDTSSLAVHTHQLSSGSMSPGDKSAGSYFSHFSPTTDASSTRSSAQSAGYSYSRKGSSPNAWNEDVNRYTAPAVSRGVSRDGPNGNAYYNVPPGRLPQRPSLPPMSASQSQAANGMAQRLRSASSPDIHHHARYAGAQVDNIPVPPIPAHMTSMLAPVNRSHNNSPSNGNLSVRPTAPSPHPPQHAEQRNVHNSSSQFHEPQYSESRSTTSPTIENPSSPLSREPDDGPAMPTQLKARVQIDDNYITLVIASNILFRSLTDRVDAKLARFTNRSIGTKTARLRYRDEDGDFVTIDSDEAVQLAFMEWREQHRDMLAKGLVGEIHLYCQPIEN